MRRAKIVCTLGPATDVEGGVRTLIECGMNVARLNMSHGSHDEQLLRYNAVRAAAEELQRGVGILADLQGPKIRLGRFADGPIELAPGDSFTITTADVLGDQHMCSTTYKGLPGDVSPGDSILVDDGKILLRVVSVDGDEVRTECVEGGPVSNSKGINLPGVAVNVPALSDKDEADLRWALRTGVDLIALSFVRRGADVADVHKIMEQEGRRVPVLAKIEKPQAVANLDDIIDKFDGIMVARGDLGVELPLEQVPLVQKEAVQKCRNRGKPVIVATQMLESMISASRPTRAEASDVANAVLDGADAVMLSGETSVGVNPEVTVATMARIVEFVEDHGLSRIPALDSGDIDVADPDRATAKTLTRVAVEVAQGVGARFLIAFTETGRSAQLVARSRPAIPLLAFTTSPAVRNQLALTWGMETFLVPAVRQTDNMVRQVDIALLELGRVAEGEKVVIVAGSPPGQSGSTNGMRVHKVGDVHEF